MNGVHGDEANAQIGIEILVGRYVTTAALEAHFHVQFAAFTDRRYVDILVQDLDVSVSLDHAGSDDTGLIRTQIKSLWSLTVQLEGDLLEVQDDVGCVFYDAGDRLELVQNAFDLDRGNSRAFNRRKQGATQSIADGGAKAALKGLSAELAILLGKRLGVDCKTFRFLKSSPKHCGIPFHAWQASRSILQRPCSLLPRLVLLAVQFDDKLLVYG